jgi:polyhydroxybutyrate depolymerase
MRTIPAVLSLLLLLGGCARDTASDTADGTSQRSLSVGGVARTYRLYVPDGLPEHAPLVVMLHGGFGSGRQAEKAYGWDAEADAGHFVVAYPDGLNRAWNTGGGCCGPPGRTGVDDVGFLTALVDEVGREVPLDPERVYATGISNGGIMSYTLACTTGVFAAVGPDAATQLGDCAHPKPASVIHVHGTGDHNIPYDGRPGNGVATIDGPPVPEVNARWRSVDRCDEPKVTVAGPVTRSLASCPDGRAVELVTVDGGGHEWPDTPIDATHEIWTFFASHPAVSG